jgi:lysophospholipase L1-like esterase
VVPAEGARLVDAYPLFLGRESSLIMGDGLHLTPQGYRVLAEAFATAIRETASASSTIVRRR